MQFNFSKFVKSFLFAWKGLTNAFSKEQNFRVELFSLIFILCFGIFFRLSIFEWAWILISAFLVLITELLNTSIERLTDLIIDKRKTGLAKQAKDIAAGAVLMASLQAIIAGCIIFLPKIFK